MEEKDVLVDKFQSSVQALNEDVVKTNEEKLLQKNVSVNEIMHLSADFMVPILEQNAGFSLLIYSFTNARNSVE